jgi:hypothetical protein
VEKKEDVTFLKSLCEPKKLASFRFLLTRESDVLGDYSPLPFIKAETLSEVLLVCQETQALKRKITL